MRGSTGSVRDRQRVYVDDLRDAGPVLDVGCGRGELLSLLREAGVEARGIDADADMVAYARGEGLEVEQADAVAYLERLADGALGGIFAGQVVEHLPPAALLRLFELAAEKLRPGGVLVAETINPLSPLALRSYFADLTHSQPLVPETLALLARQAGFREVETRFLNEPAEKLAIPDDPTIAANVRKLNDISSPLWITRFWLEREPPRLPVAFIRGEVGPGPGVARAAVHALRRGRGPTGETGRFPRETQR